MRSDVAAAADAVDVVAADADVVVDADADVKHMLRFCYREVVRLQKN